MGNVGPNRKATKKQKPDIRIKTNVWIIKATGSQRPDRLVCTREDLDVAMKGES